VIHMNHRRRVGFTLLELLAVIAILAALAALATGTYFRLRASSQKDMTEKTVTKLESAFQNVWKAELDAARDAFKGKTPGYTSEADKVRAIAGGDQDRALALWNYFWMKNAFPQTFQEANMNTTLSATINGFPVTASLPARFPGIGGVQLFRDQAAVLLHRILTQKGARGQVFSEESIGVLSQKLDTTNFRIFTDTFGHPILFVRYCAGNQGDLNSAPYLKPGNTSRDPFDPQGRLLASKWTVALPPMPPQPQPRVQAATSLGLTDFADANWVPTLVSRGSAPAWDAAFLAGPLPPTLAPGLIQIPDGYISGYKLRQQGARGD
jgi:prepilin-type N-terminal cleavage/methylation domain-containing protein